MSPIRSGSASARGEILEAASAWFDRMQDDGQTLDRAALDRWLRERPEHRVAFEAVRNAHARVCTAAEDPAILALRHETALRLTRRARRPRLGTSLAAALAAIAVGAAIWVQLDLSDGGSRLPLVAQAPRSPGAGESGSYATRIGERLVVTLVDGSRITLNTNTKLQEAFDRTERRVVLDHGQALFEVAHDAVRPFVVEAHGRRLVALGTAFDVRVDGARVQVTMLEGIVSVERTTGVPGVGVEGSVEEAVPLRIATLTAGEQLTTEAARADRVTIADPQQVTSWRRGQLIFEDVPLAEAIEEINRYSQRRIELADASLAQLRLSGAFATGRPEVFVEALTTYFPIDVQRREAARIILGSRE